MPVGSTQTLPAELLSTVGKVLESISKTAKSEP